MAYGSIGFSLSGKHDTDKWPEQISVYVKVTDASPGSHGSYWEPPEPPQVEDFRAYWGEENEDEFMNVPGQDFMDPLPEELVDLYIDEIMNAAYDAFTDYMRHGNEYY